ncbi:MAG: response regulator transcription factor [Polaribacter sp.]|nr:response regulator transcription factor [Polaribacter sp.]
MQETKKTPIAIVDDKRLLRNSLSEQLQYNQPIEVLFTAENGIDFLKQMEQRPKNSHPLVVLMDIEMPEMDGLETVLISKEIYPDIQFLMLTAFSEDEKIFEAVKAGASGYLLKDEKYQKLFPQSLNCSMKEQCQCRQLLQKNIRNAAYFRETNTNNFRKKPRIN